MGGVNGKGNKFVSPPNQKFQIFANPIPNHASNFAQAYEDKNDDKNDDKNGDENDDKNNDEDGLDNMDSLINVQPHKGKMNLLPNISFTHIHASIHVSDVPLYITDRINDKPTKGITNDHVCLENDIIEEFMYVHELYQYCYEQSNS